MVSFVEVRDAEVGGQIVDVEWCDGMVVRVGARRSSADSSGAHVIEAGGGALIPALHDHHVHLLALAAARESVQVGPLEVVGRSDLGRVLAAACADRGARTGWVRAVGYHESVAGDLDAATLDELVPAGRDVAIRIQHRSGQLWTLNRRAIAVSGLAEVDVEGVERDATGEPTGRVFGADRELRSRWPSATPDLAALGRELASYGVTGVTDLTPTNSSADVELLAEEVGRDDFPVRVTITGGPHLDAAAGSGLERGPVKWLPADHRVPDVDALADGFRSAHRSGRSVAVHCVSRVGLVVALSAWRTVGVVRGDRIEHGAVIPGDLIDEIAALGLVVVTQPNFVAERGDQYLADVETDDQPHLWRCRSLVDRGVSVVGGTDAPFGHPDPWRAIRAAMERTTSSGRPLGLDERLEAEPALALFLGSAQTPTVRRRVAVGEITDLCLLDRPLRSILADPTADGVRLTIGRCGAVPSGPGD